MAVIGETLRRERTRRGLDLDQISRQTKISVRLLEAIENEQFDKLPGGVFTKSFVKQYARVLGLDEEELGHELDRLLQPAQEAPLPADSEPELPIRVPRVTEWEGVGHARENSSLPALALLVAVMLLASGFYAWWQRSRHPAPHETVSTAAPAAQQPAAEPAPAAPPPVAATSHEPNSGRPPGETVPPSAKPETTPPAASPEATTAPAPTGTIGNPAGSVQVTLKATEPVWVKCWVDGQVMLVTTLQANDSRTLGASESVRLRVGNAGGLEVELNGKPVGPLGPRGQIRVVQFTQKGLEVIPLTPPAPQDRLDTL